MKIFTNKSRKEEKDPEWAPWRQKLHEIIFEHYTFWGKEFDVILLWAIFLSIIAVMLESVESVRMKHGEVLRAIEWGFTIAFTLEYIARICSVKKPIYYITSFYGIVDLLAILPTYLSIFFAGGQYLMVIRTFRLLRVFRILKLARFLGESRLLQAALKASRYKITVFFGAVVIIVTIMGTLMYLVEGPENGFKSIPISVYWAIVTLTTVGYGDIAPQTVLGQALASIIMLLGYAIIAVPTGIVTSEITQASMEKKRNNVCDHCSAEGHDIDANYCRKCGAKFNNPEYPT